MLQLVDPDGPRAARWAGVRRSVLRTTAGQSRCSRCASLGVTETLRMQVASAFTLPTPTADYNQGKPQKYLTQRLKTRGNG